MSQLIWTKVEPTNDPDTCGITSIGIDYSGERFAYIELDGDSYYCVIDDDPDEIYFGQPGYLTEEEAIEAAEYIFQNHEGPATFYDGEFD